MVVDNESMGFSIVLGRDFLTQRRAKIIIDNDTIVNVNENIKHTNEMRLLKCKENIDDSKLYKMERKFEVNNDDDEITTVVGNDNENVIINNVRKTCENEKDDNFEMQILSIDYTEQNVEYNVGEHIDYKQKFEFASLFQECYINPKRPDEPLVKCEMSLIIEDKKVFNYAPRRLSYAEKAE